MGKAPKAIREGTKAAMQAIHAEVESWKPKGARWPALGERVKLIAPHPWAGEHGEVIGFKVLGMFPAEGLKPLVRMDNGREAFITQPFEWKKA